MMCAGEIMDFPQKTFDEFAEYYGFKDKDEVYSNGSELIPVFRVKQWLEHMQEPKSEWEQDHAILKAYSDGQKEILDKIRAEIEAEPYVSKMEVLDIIDKYKAESEVEDGSTN